MTVSQSSIPLTVRVAAGAMDGDHSSSVLVPVRVSTATVRPAKVVEAHAATTGQRIVGGDGRVARFDAQERRPDPRVVDRPLVVALATSRSRREWLIAVAAAAGVYVLVLPGPSSDFVGLGLDLLAAGCWL